MKLLKLQVSANMFSERAGTPDDIRGYHDNIRGYHDNIHGYYNDAASASANDLVGCVGGLTGQSATSGPFQSAEPKEIHMSCTKHLPLLTALLLHAGFTLAQDEAGDMSFFITSENPGEGADLGGLEGADAHCTALAEAAGTTGNTWAAYLSTSSVDARDRIGSGPWTNAEGTVVAESVEQLLDAEANNLDKQTALDQNGAVVNGRGDEPNRHDILTGTNADGTFSGNSCDDWTSSASDGAATVGHHDRTGGGDDPTSWSSAHPSRGCGLEDLRGTGGDGLFYCFATD